MSDWKSEIEKRIHEAAVVVERAIDRSRDKLGLLPAVEDVEHVQAYCGYATIDRVIVMGRVLANQPARPAEEDDNWWNNLGAMWRRVNSKEVIGARVVLSYAGIEQTVTTGEEGYDQATFDRVDPGMDSELRGVWSKVHVRVPGAGRKVEAQHALLVPSSAAQFGIISDMDDTVIHTGATQLLLMMRQTMFGNARLRQPLAGVATFYHALQRGGAAGAAATQGPINPLFYVSSSPWNLYGLLVEFLRHNDIPPGPLMLRDYGIDETKLIAEKGHRHKLEKAERIIAAYPDLRFVLIGDSGQDDAEIYAEVAHRHPDRIAAVYIRDVDPGNESKHDERVDGFIEKVVETGVPMLRAVDSLAMAEHAAGLGLITHEDVAAVAENVDRDEKIPATVGEAIEEAVETEP